MKLRIVDRPTDTVGDVEILAAGIEVGRDIAALGILPLVRNRTTVAASPVGTLLLAANEDRVVAVIKNVGSTPLHINMPSGTAGELAEQDVVQPGQRWDSADTVIAAINGWWDTGPGGAAPTGQALVTETVPQFGGATSGGSGSGGGGATAVAAPKPRQNVAFVGGAGSIIAASAIPGIPAGALAYVFSIFVRAAAAVDAFLYDAPNGNAIAVIPAGTIGPISLGGPVTFSNLSADANVPASTYGVGY